MTDYIDIFSKSFERAVGNNQNAPKFFERFYAVFTSKSIAIKKRFDAIPPERRNPMVRESLLELMNFYASGRASGEMERLGRLHNQEHANIPPKMYAWWLESLMQTVEEFDPAYTPDVDAAWRIVVTPGIAFMTRNWAGIETGQSPG